MDTLLTVEQVAAQLQVAPETVRRLARSGALPFFRVGVSLRASMRFEAGDVERFVAARKAAATVAVRRRQANTPVS